MIVVQSSNTPTYLLNVVFLQGEILRTGQLMLPVAVELIRKDRLRKLDINQT